MANYGRYLRRKGDLDRAESVLNDVLANDRIARGERHPFVGHGACASDQYGIRASHRHALGNDVPYRRTGLRLGMGKGDVKKALAEKLPTPSLMSLN